MTPMEEQAAMQAYVRQQIPQPQAPQWMQSVYGAALLPQTPGTMLPQTPGTMLPQTPGTMLPEDYVVNPQRIGRSVVQPELFAQHDPMIYGSPAQPTGNQDTVIYAPQPAFVNTMPKSWFSSDPSMAGASTDRLIRDQRILGLQNYDPNDPNRPIYRDRDMNALTRSGGGGNP